MVRRVKERMYRVHERAAEHDPIRGLLRVISGMNPGRYMVFLYSFSECARAALAPDR